MTLLDRLRAGDPLATARATLAGAALLVVGGAAAMVVVHPLIVLAAAAALGVAPLVLRDIRRAFLAVVAVIMLLPFAAIPLGVGFNPTFLDLALGVLYLIWLMRIVTREQVPARRPPLALGVALFAGLMVAALLAGLGHGTPTRNQLRVFGEMVLGAGLFFVAGDLITGRDGLRWVFRALVGLGCASAAVGLGLYVLPDAWQMELLSLLRVVDYPSGPGVLRYLNDDPTRLQRATGTSIDPNSFGGTLAVIAALLLPQALDRAPSVPRRLAVAMAVVVIAALVATVSRGSLVGLAAAVGVIGLLRDRRLLATGLVAGLGLIALAAVVPWTAAYVEHFTAGLLTEDRATQMRLGEYKDAMRLIERYPLFGVGFGDPGDVDLYRGVSSLYFIVAETMGLVGLGAFAALMAAALGRLFVAWRRAAGTAGEPGDVRPILLGCLAALTAALVSGLFDHYFFTYAHAFALLWLVIALGMRGAALAAPPPASRLAPRGGPPPRAGEDVHSEVHHVQTVHPPPLRRGGSAREAPPGRG